MADSPFPTNPFFKSWLQWQEDMLAAQDPFWRQVSQTLPTPDPEGVEALETLWSAAQRQSRDWLAGAGLAATGQDGIPQEMLRKMMDPSQFLFAGSDEVNRTIQKLVEGPEFADIGMLERKGLQTTGEWIALREASNAYRQITLKAWSRAFALFSKDTMGNTALWSEGPRAVLDRWLDIANEELIRTQRTPDFLEAQKRLLRAGVDYRLRERDMVEIWCETHSIPTRTEIDDLHATVYRLRHEVRALKKDLATLAKPAPKTRRTPAGKSTKGDS